MGEKIKIQSIFLRSIHLLLLIFLIQSLGFTESQYFYQADRALLSCDYDEAIAKYLKGINYSKFRETSLICDDLGYAFLQKGEIAKAQDYLKRALASYPDNYNIKFYLAVSYIINEEIESAMSELKDIENNIYFDDSWTEIASKSQIYNKYSDRVLEEQWNRLKKEKGVLLYKKNHRKRGASRLTLQIDAFDERNEGIFCFAQGVVNNKQGLSKLAEQKFAEAKKKGYHEKELIPSKINHRLKDHDIFLLWTLHEESLKELERGMLDKSIEILEDALLVDESSFFINHNLALLYFDMAEFQKFETQKLDKAEIYCSRAIWFKELHKTDKEYLPGCYDLMGNIYYHQKRYEQAQKEFMRIIKLETRNPGAHYNLGSVYYKMKYPDNAEFEWKTAIDLEKKTAKKTKPKDSPENGLTYSLTVRRKSISFFAHKSLGDLYLERDHVDKAITQFENAIELNPNEAETYLALAKAYHKKNELEKAKSTLEKYLYLGGEKELAKELERLLKNRDSVTLFWTVRCTDPAFFTV